MEICTKSLCSACWACRDICPKNCINISYDSLDVPYPVIDESECVNCGLCQRVCPNNTPVVLNAPMKAYAAWSNDLNVRRTSASGGVATELYRLFFRQGGIATGVILDENYDTKYVILDDKSDLTPVKNSKYTFSDTNDIYRKVKIYLDKEVKVLFIGLPCHVAALQNYLRRPYDNLTTVDIICHGVAPVDYLKQHIKNIELKKGKKTAECTFRDPHYKTHNFIFSLYDKDSKCFYHKRVESNDLYQIGYHRALIYRENCYHCKYAAPARCSDLTIGDFSGLGRLEKCDFNNINVSCILVNTVNGAEVIDSLSSFVTMVERPLAEALDFEPQLQTPSVKHHNRDVFKAKYSETQDFTVAAAESLKSEIRNSNLPPHFISRTVKAGLRAILPKRVIKLIKLITRNG